MKTYTIEISTHAPRTGSDGESSISSQLSQKFQPTLPARGATDGRCRFRKPIIKFQPTLPARGATVRRLAGNVSRGCNFNPRSPHGERLWLPSRARTLPDFNPRSPHGERRPSSWWRPARRKHFNPRSPHGERQHVFRVIGNAERISTHAPRTGSDTIVTPAAAAQYQFQPTLPARGATWMRVRYNKSTVSISTHAPRTGSDTKRLDALEGRKKFQPTLPARGATQQIGCITQFTGISTHAPRTGSDETSTPAPSYIMAFQPTLPARGATSPGQKEVMIMKFQPTLPARGATKPCFW